MYWLTFVALSILLYLPPLDLAQHLWQWAQVQEWWVLVLGWPAPAWLAYIWWSVFVYVALGTALHAGHRRLPVDSSPAKAVMRLSLVRLGELDVAAAAVALLTLALAWPILPILRGRYGWSANISVPVAALACVYLVAEALRLAEGHYWADRAYEASRLTWLADQGH